MSVQAIQLGQVRGQLGLAFLDRAVLLVEPLLTLGQAVDVELPQLPAPNVVGGKVDFIDPRVDAAACQRIGIRSMMNLSLTIDHRVVTGGEAARFLARVIADLELPQ